MSLWDHMKWSLRHSKKQLLESLLVVMAIALGVGVIITVLSMFLSVGQQYRGLEQAEHFRTLEVLGKHESSRREGAPLTLLGSDLASAEWSSSLEEIAEFQRQLPSTMHAYVEMHWAGETPLLATEDDSEEDIFWYYSPNQIFVMGTLPEYFAFNQSTLQSGNFFLTEDVQNNNQVIVIPHSLAEELYGEKDPLGEILPLTLFGGEEAVDYTVIGVLAQPPKDEGPVSFDVSSRMSYAPITVAPYGEGEQATFRSISVGVDAGVDLTAALERVTSEASLLWGDEIAVRSSLVEYRQSQAQMQRYALLIGLFASVGLVIAVINILNLMLARVLKRTKSIGLSLALGSSRQVVFRQFIMESITLGLTGSVFGIVLSFVLGKLLEKTLGTIFAANMWGTRAFLGIAMGFVVSFFFGVYPAYLASRTNPVDALRTD